MVAGGDAQQAVFAQLGFDGLGPVSDTGAIDGFAEQAIAVNEKVAAEFRSGKEAVLMFLVGQVMKLSRGKANPQLAAEALRRKLQS